MSFAIIICACGQLYSNAEMVSLIETIFHYWLQAMRLFVGEPIWTPYNRPQDEHPVRKDYIDHFLKTQLNKKDVSLAK